MKYLFRYIIFLFILISPLIALADTITGKVSNNDNQALSGANIYWINTKIGVISDNNGEFEISTKDISDKQLIIRYVGYKTDTLKLQNQKHIEVTLNQSSSTEEVIVSAERSGVIISSFNPIKTEQITRTELTKSACCDLAGCFETQTTVKAQTTNIITNSKELRILGLSGVYNQVLIDGFPMIKGLSYTYGISSIPGTLVENIFVAKGANSVLQGYESFSGQINIETLKPQTSDKLLLNLYTNSFLEKQFNANYSFKNDNWSNISTFHTTQPANKINTNEDNFLDTPLLTRYMFFNKFQYGNKNQEGLNSQLAIRIVNENRIGGQSNYDNTTDQGSGDIYGQSVSITQPEFWTKSQYIINENHNFSYYLSAFNQNQNSYFGTVKYDAEHLNLFTNLQYDFNYSNHNLKTGISFKHSNLQEEISFTQTNLERNYNGDYQNNENIIGLFAENTLTILEDELTWITGLRLDNHNNFGTFLTPRTLIKYNFSPETIIRANIGTAWRVVNLFSENINLLVSSRDIIFEEELKPEKALNYGINLTHDFGSSQDNISGYFSTDFYRTDFQNQIFPDYDTDPSKAIIENFTGTSISNGFQAELFLKLFQEFELKTGYNFLDVFREINNKKEELPFNSKHKILVAVNYKPTSKLFQIDANAHWYGKQKLPSTQSNPVEFRRPDYSENFIILNSQVSFNYEQFKIYFGCENILDFRQNEPILNWQNPFEKYFDSSLSWGPTKGREFYLGLTFKIE